MGHKVHPLGFRLGVIRNWQAKWYAEKGYVDFLQEDLKIRQAIEDGYTEAGVSLVEIDRQANKVAITIHTARPGVVIGRGGQRVDEMRANLESLIGKRIQLSILEIQQPELDAFLVARAVAEQIEHRVAFRRAMKQAMFRTMQAGAKGMRISCAGRLGGAEIARREVMHQGQVPLHTLRADIDYGLTEARTTLGRIGVKVWIYRGDILPEPSRLEAEAEEEPAEPAAVGGVETKAPVTPEAEEKPAAPVAEEKAEAVVETKPEEKAPEAKPKKKAPVAKREAPEAKVKEKVPEVKPKKKAPEAKVKEKAPKPKKEAPEAKPKEKAVKAEEKAPEAEKKTPKRRTMKTTKAKSPVTEGKEETDATAQAGEVPQES